MLTTSKRKLAGAALVLVAGLALGLPNSTHGPRPAPAAPAPVPVELKGKIWLLADGHRISTTDGRHRRPVKLKEGRRFRWVSPAQNLVWFEGAGGALHVRPLNNPSSTPSNLGVPAGDCFYLSREGTVAFGRSLGKHYMVEARTKKRTRINVPRGCFAYDIAPDGSWVLALEARAPADPQFRLHKVPLEGGKPVLLTGELNVSWGGRLSPDGKRIVAHAMHNKGAGLWDGATYVIDVATRKATKISRAEKQGWSHGVWSPDGKRVAYLWGEGPTDPTRGRLVVCDADGKNARVILTTKELTVPIAWR
jgi:hypothetical protein